MCSDACPSDSRPEGTSEERLRRRLRGLACGLEGAAFSEIAAGVPALDSDVDGSENGGWSVA